MASEVEVLHDIYLQTRLRHMGRANALPGSGQFDFARSGLSDDQLEQVQSRWGAGAPDQHGWGLSSVFDEMLSREPATMSTPDLSALQDRLKQQGFASPDTPTDGVWSPFWSSTFRRADRDAFDAHLSGSHFLSKPFTAAFQFLGYLAPSKVFQGIVGSAKGFVQQAPETLGRIPSSLEAGGALGGAAEGAIIGGMFGSVVPVVGTAVGAISGAVAGGVAGFFADLLGHDKSEEHQNLLGNIWDSLSPYDEYRKGTQGWKNFVEDLGWISTAASLLSGARLGVTAAREGLALAGEQGLTTNIQAAAIKEAGGLTPAIEAGTAQNVGFTARLASMGMKPESQEAFREFIAKHGLIAQTSRPLMQTINGAYTGLSAASVGARLAGGAGGQADVYDAKGKRLLDRPGTTISEAIESAPELPGGKYLDWASLVIQPTQFLPFKLSHAADSLNEVFGRSHLFPYEIAAGIKEDGVWQSASKRLEKIVGSLSMGVKDAYDNPDKLTAATSDLLLRTTFGRDAKVASEFEGTELNMVARHTQRLQREAEINRNFLDEMSQGFSSEKIDYVDETLPKARFFHGSSTAISELRPTYEVGSAERNLFGPGFYVTDEPAVAQNYTRKGLRDAESKGKAARNVVGLNLSGPERFIDMEAPLPDDVATEMQRALRGIGWDETQAAEWGRDLSGKTGTEYFNALKQELADAEIPTHDAGEIMWELSDSLAEKGYTGYKYAGGRRIKGASPHNAFMFFRPQESLEIVGSAAMGKVVKTTTAAALNFDDLTPEELRAKLPVLNELLSWSAPTLNDSRKGPTSFGAFLARLNPSGRRGIEGMARYTEAVNMGETIAKDYVNGAVKLSYGEGGAKAGTVRVLTAPGGIPNREYANMTKQMDRLYSEASDIESNLDLGSPELGVAKAKELRAQADDIGRQLEDTPEWFAPKRGLSIVPVLADSPDEGIVGTVTDRVLNDWHLKLVAARDRLESAKENLIASQRPEILTEVNNAKQGMKDVALELQKRDLIGQKQFRAMMADLDPAHFAQFKPKPSAYDPYDAAILDLEDLGKSGVLPKEAILDDQAMQRWKALGYKPAITGGDQLMWSDMPKAMARHNMDLFTTDRNFMDSIRYGLETVGLSPAKDTSHSLFQFRRAKQEQEVHQVALANNVDLNGRQLMKRVARWMEVHNNGDGVVSQTTHVGPLLIRTRPGAAGERVRDIGMPMLDARQLRPDQLIEALDLHAYTAHPEELAQKFYHAIKKGSALGADLDLRHPLDTLRMLGAATRVDGLPGWVDFMRTAHLTDPRGAVIAAGAFTGYEQGKEKGVLGGLEGAITGAVSGAVMEKMLRHMKPGSWEYLPDVLHRASMAMRYTFSLSFDLGRYMEQAMLGSAREGLPIIFSPKRYIMRHYGEAGWKDALRLRDAMRGGHDFELMDEMDRRLFQEGILGYSPRLHEAAAAYMIKKANPSMTLQELEHRVTMLEGYGIGRSQMEKSVNVFFFPLSFQKKLVTSLGDAVLQAPARAFLISEGYRRFHQMGLDEKARGFIEKYVPLADQLKRLNNLAFGLGPGRFFLQGYEDNKTPLGKAAAALTTMFVPSGANTPVAQLFGGLGDSAVHLFSPQVITDDTPVDEALGAIDRFIPAIRDLDNFFTGAHEELQAVTSGGDPFYQLQAYLDKKRSIEANIEPMSKAFGFNTVQGFLSSDVGAAARQEYDADLLTAKDQYPLGFQKAQEFENSTAINDKMLADLANKPNRTEAEDNILRLSIMEQSSKQMADLLGIPQNEMLATTQQNLRAEALKHISDPRFREYWKRFFEDRYGPIERITAA